MPPFHNAKEEARTKKKNEVREMRKNKLFVPNCQYVRERKRGCVVSKG